MSPIGPGLCKTNWSNTVNPENPLECFRQVICTGSKLNIIEPDGKKFPMNGEYDGGRIICVGSGIA